jgi:enoyl-CoA hydratase
MTVRSEIDGAVLVVTIDRPDRRNAVDGPTATALTEAFRAFEADDAVAVAVLTGAGGTFCAGADLKAIFDGWEGREDGKPVDPRSLSEGEGPLGPTRMLCSKPVIAAVEGYAVAGGLELALWCDLRVAAHDAVFGVFCRRWGVPLIDGGTVRLPRLIGMSHALDLILTGRGVSGDEALRMGLANRLTDTGGALDGAVTLANELARLPQACMREDRASTYEQAGLLLDEALRNEHEHGIKLLKSREFRDGVARFGAGAGRHGRPAPEET